MSISTEPVEPVEVPLRSRLKARRGAFVALMTLASALGMAKGLLFAKILGDQAFGYYGLVMLVVQPGLYLSNWGVLSALNNQLPMAYGRGDSGMRELVDRSLGTLLAFSLGTAAVYLIVLNMLPGSDVDARVALSLAAVVTVVTALCEFFVLLLRVERRLIPLASMYLLRALAAIGLGCGAALLWGYRGVLGAELAALVITIVLSWRAWVPWVRVLAPSRERTRWLLRWGFPLMAANLVVIGTFTADRMFVAAALPRELGQYTFASLIVTVWLAIAGMLNQVFAPQFLFEYGAGVSLRALRRRALKIDVMATGLGAIGLVGVILIAGWLQEGTYSAYGPGLDVMPILYVGGLLSVLAFPGFILPAVRPLYSTGAALAGALVVLVGGFVLVAGSPGLAAFAWLFVIGQAVALVVTLAGVEIESRRSPSS